MPLYGGIDLHVNHSVIVLLDEHDQVVYQQRFANHLPMILEQLVPYQVDLKGVVEESTPNGYWLVDGFLESDYRLMGVFPDNHRRDDSQPRRSLHSANRQRRDGWRVQARHQCCNHPQRH